MDQQLLRVEEVARILGVKTSTIRQWIFKKKFRVVKVGRAVRIPSDFLEHFIEENTRPERSLTTRRSP
jgi:excisionase family DNA binding protein